MNFGRPTRHAVRAFTLVEMLLALAISAIVLTAIGGVLFGATRLRERTSEALEAALPENQALSILRLDLLGAVGPSNVLQGDFLCGSPNVGTKMGLSAAQGNAGLDFFTSTGVINDDEPWGDIQEVYYQLVDPTDRNHALGHDLVRNVNRNLLATATVTPEVQWLMGNVQSVQFECFDGTQWRPNWDTSNGDTNLPMAVRVTIQRAVEPNVDIRNVQPFQMVVPLVAQTISTNQP
jgi:type II secretion system protein J